MHRIYVVRTLISLLESIQFINESRLGAHAHILFGLIAETFPLELTLTINAAALIWSFERDGFAWIHYSQFHRKFHKFTLLIL